MHIFVHGNEAHYQKLKLLRIHCLFQYYFGDINLPRDKFLQDEMKLEDGCILSQK